MATYYKWRKSQVSYSVNKAGGVAGHAIISNIEEATTALLYYSQTASANGDGIYGVYLTGNIQSIQVQTKISGNESYTPASLGVPSGNFYFSSSPDSGKKVLYANSEEVYLSYDSQYDALYFKSLSGNTIRQASGVASAGTLVGYVYSTSASAYPNGGVQGDYYYDQRTTITSPTAPTNLQYPNPITTPTVTVNWGASTSNIPSYSVSNYEISYATNGLSNWTVAATQSGTSYTMDTPTGVSSIQFRVRAKDSNGKWSSYTTGTSATILLAPTLTVPSLAMQGEGITVNWTAIAGATSYTLQRKSDTDADWVQVYSGPNLTFTETAGAWESVQYRVQATFSAGTGSWATSESIPVMSASALVISGSDGDLGTLVNDVQYTISTDTGNPISVRTTVNGAVIFAGEVESGAAKAIPVLDLINGEGTIVIEASVETSSGTVSAVRTWTYNKALIIFPNSGGPAQLTKEGKIIFPKTLAECVRLPGGRTLDKVMGFPCQIFVGSYTGTGTYGSANPNEVTIPFKPQIVFVSNGSVGTTIPMIRPLEKVKSSAALTVAWTDDGVSWSATSAANQMNANGTDYIVVAFG